MDYGYDVGYDVGSSVATGVGAFFGILAFIWIIAMAISIFSIICNWKVFKKAGKNGWEAIIPIYNMIVLLEITKLPMWYLVLFFVPIGNIVVLFLIYIELAKKFGQSTGFGIGLVFLNPIFMAMLAFNKNYVYQGVQGAMSNTTVVYNNQQTQMSQQPVQPVSEQPVQPVSEQPVQPVNEQPVQPVSEQPVQPVSEQPMQMNAQPAQLTSCPNCGSPINAGDKFCMHCGNQL